MKVGIRIPTWATYVHDVYAGIADFIRLNGPWHLQTMKDSTNEMKPVEIDENWEGDGLIAFRLQGAVMRCLTRDALERDYG